MKKFVSIKFLVLLLSSWIAFSAVLIEPNIVNGASSVDPVSYWKFDEGYGTTAYDEMASNNGTLTNGPIIKDEGMCVSRKCLFFDGSNDYVTAADSAPLDITGALSISMWVRPSKLPGTSQILLSKDKDTVTADRSYALYINSSGKLTMYISQNVSGSTSITAASTETLVAGKWYHVEGVFTPSTSVKLYINGNIDSTNTTSVPASIYSSTQAVSIGYRISGTAEAFKGFIDEPKIFNYARSANEVGQEYISKGARAGSTVQIGNNASGKYITDNLVGYWKFDEDSWNGTASEIKDSSGNSSHGVSVGSMTTTALGKFDKAGLYDGVNDYINIPDADTQDLFDFGTGDYTLSAWIKGGSQGTSSRIIIKNSAFYLNAQNTGICSANKAVFEKPSGGSGLCSTTSINDSAWHLITGIRKGDNAYLYIDGVLEATGTGWSSESATSANALNFSYSTANNYFTGSIDEGRIYSKALTPYDVRQLYKFSGPVNLFHKLDENTGTTSTNDYSGNGFSGILTDIVAADWEPGKYGSSLRLTSGNEMVHAADNLYNRCTSQCTIMAWVKPFAYPGSFNVIINKGNWATAVNYYAFYFDGTNLNFDVGGAATYDNVVTPRTNVPLNTWSHISMTWDGTTIRGYINGVQVTSGAQTQTPNTASYVFSSGNFGSGGWPYNGNIDEIKQYLYPRTPEQIVEDMNAGLPDGGATAGSAISHWKFDEATGTTANDSNYNANNLTLSTQSWTTDGKYNSAWKGTGALWLSRADDVDFDFSASESFTITGWFKHDTASAVEVILNKEESTGADGGYRVQMESDGDITFGIDDDNISFPEDSVTSTAATYDDNAWHHFAAVKTGTTSMKLYIDGIKVGTDDTSISSTGTLANDDTLYIGDSNGIDDSDEFIGSLDDIKIFRYALTKEQVAMDFSKSGASVSLGSVSTASNGTTFDNSSARSYCVPGDSSTCTAPVGDWRFDENTGTSANDISGNGNTLTLTNSPTYVPGKKGTAIRFAGSNAQLTRADDADFDFGAGGSFSIGLWFKHATASAQEILVSKFNEAGYKIIMESDGDITCGIDYDSTWTPTDSVTSTAATYDDDAWHYVSCIKNANTSLSLYIDNVLIGSDTSLTNSTLANSDPLYVGIDADGLSNDWVGLLDNLVIYNTARSTAQNSWDYDKGAPIGWYKFDEGANTTIFNSAFNANGQAIGNDGTLTLGASPSTATAWSNGASGKLNSSMDFDGTDDYVDMNDVDNYDFVDGQNFTISAWVNRDTFTTDDTIVAKKDNQLNSTAGYVMWIDDSTDDVRLAVSDGDSANLHVVDSASTITSTGWNHVVVVFDDSGSTASRIYINGKLDSTTNTTTGTFTSIGDLSNAVDFRIGSESDTGEPWDGKIDDVRVYRYDLTAEQIKTLYNNGSSSLR
jgi:hypothetical protein